MVDFSRLTLASLQAPGGVLSGASDLVRTLVAAPGQRKAAENKGLELQLNQGRFEQQQDLANRREERIAGNERERLDLQKQGMVIREKESAASKKARDDARLRDQAFGLQEDIDVLTRDKETLAAKLQEAQLGVDAARQKAAEKLGKDIDSKVNSQFTQRALAEGIPLIARNPEDQATIERVKSEIRNKLAEDINSKAASSSDVKSAVAALEKLQAQQGIYDQGIRTKQEQLQQLQGLMMPPEEEAAAPNLFRPVEGLLRSLAGAAGSLTGLTAPEEPSTLQGQSEEERTASILDANGMPPEDLGVQGIIEQLGGEVPGTIATTVNPQEAAEQKNALFADLRNNPLTRADMVKRTLPTFNKAVSDSVTQLRTNINKMQQRRRIGPLEKEKLERAVPPTIRADVTTAAFAQLTDLGKGISETTKLAEHIGNSIKLGDLEVFQNRRDQTIEADKKRKHQAWVIQSGGDALGGASIEPTDAEAITADVYQRWLNEIIGRYKNTGG